MYSLQEATHLEFKSIYEVFSIIKYSLDKITGDLNFLLSFLNYFYTNFITLVSHWYAY